ncbi:hypothetical protein TrRE_jg6757 [Triparma retinervis]|uniref:Protein kinase domain-containing protein n=1 Tax=Triparma retinervis TaxID=2557542 RepID=A0A9W7F5A4_9STRA|nr:hypothetical protein TrRE_jg6757 [Triparma retinervis]
MGQSISGCLESIFGPRKRDVKVDLGTPMPPTPATMAGKRGNDYNNNTGQKYKYNWSKGYGSIDSNGLEREEERAPLVAPSSSSYNNSKKKIPSSSSNTSSTNGSSQSPQKHQAQVLTDKYTLLDVLGVGSTSTCHRCRRNSDSVMFACKIIDKRHIEERFRGLLSQFGVEIEVLKELNHPGIIKLSDVYTTESKIYMVMELMSGGELFDYVVEKGTLTEEEASRIVRGVVGAVVYMHDKGIIHRDLKPENLLLKARPQGGEKEGARVECKIIDFGLSKFIQTGGMATSFLGTRGYLAPEMLQRRDYSASVDVWALGVIVFVLLCGCLPFDDDSTVPSDALIRSKFVLRFPKWAQNLSESSKDLLMHLLDTNPKTRYTADQALAHPWVQGRSVKAENYLQSPRIIKTPMTGKRTPGKNKNKVQDRARSDGGKRKVKRQNSL